MFIIASDSYNGFGDGIMGVKNGKYELNGAGYGLIITFNGLKVEWYVNLSGNSLDVYQMNKSGRTYNYVAIG